MGMAGELILGIAAVVAAFALVWFGRMYSHTSFMNVGFVHVTYPAVVLVFIAFGVALLITALR
jgi:hypothetical protein